MKIRVGAYPTSSDFYVLLYHDVYHAQLYAIWHICTQSMLRLDVHASLGQSVKNELVLKGDTTSRRVQCFSSHPHEVYVRNFQHIFLYF